MKRQHKFAILRYSKGKLWLLALPLFRSLVLLKFDFYYWVKNAYMDIIVILLMFGSAYLKWKFVCFEAREKEFYVKKGVLFRSEFMIPYYVISSATYHIPIFFRPFKAVRILLNTESENTKKEEIDLIVSETDYLQIFNNLPKYSEGNFVRCSSSKKGTIIFSFLFSSALSGIFFIVIFLVRWNRFVGEKSGEDLSLTFEGAERILKTVTEGTASVLTTLMVITASGWLLSFAKNLLQNINFKTSRCGKDIFVEKGHFSRWKYYVNYSRINYVDQQQNLLMKITKTTSVHISCAGYGRGKNEYPFIPITTEGYVRDVMRVVLPDFTESNIQISTRRTYILLPLAAVVSVLIAAAYFFRNFPESRGAVEFPAVMLELLLIQLLVVRTVARRGTGIGVDGNSLTIRYCRGYRFHTVIVPKSSVAYIKIRRTPFQHVSGCCDIVIYTKGKRLKGHRVRGIRFSEAVSFSASYDKIGYNAYFQALKKRNSVTNE